MRLVWSERRRFSLLVITGLLLVLSLGHGRAQPSGFAEAAGRAPSATPTPVYTPACGTLQHDVIWTLANSPYELTCFVDVPQGITLTMEPGVVVKEAAPGLAVEGTLIAQGTPTSPIRISGGETTILLDGPSGTYLLSHMDISHGGTCLKVFVSIALSNLHVHNCGTGIEMANESISVANSVIDLNNQGIILASGASVSSSALVNNDTAVTVNGERVSLRGNDIYSNMKAITVNLQSTVPIDATGSYWGTTDLNAIAQSINDCRIRYELACVSVSPISPTPVSVLPTEFQPTPTPSPTLTPTRTPIPTPTRTPVPVVFSIAALRAEPDRSNYSIDDPALPSVAVHARVDLAIYVDLTSFPAGTVLYTQTWVYKGQNQVDYGNDRFQLKPSDGKSSYRIWLPHTFNYAGQYRVVSAVTVGNKTAQKTIWLTVHQPFAPHLSVSPTTATVGKQVTVTVSSLWWPSRASVSLQLKSRHHFWKGPGVWAQSCKCFRATLTLARLSHGPEIAAVMAIVSTGGKAYHLQGSLRIIGLAPPTPTPAPRPTAAPTRPAPSPPHFQVKAWVSPSSMPYDYYPTLYAQTTPGANCSASVVYTTGRSPVSFSGEPQRVGASGKVSWSWHEETEGSGGTATVTCSLSGKSLTATAYFSVD